MDEHLSLEGVLLINKEEGKTSFSLVNTLRRLTNIQKIGHAGTLDPFASGLMILLIGKKFTKMSDLFLSHDKEYVGRLCFGAKTETYDSESPTIFVSSYVPSLEQIQQVIATSFHGTIEQTPPMFSAKKVQGKKLYELARKGITIERKKEKVTLYVQIIHYAYPHLDLHITCSKGTYIRSLAHDLGEQLSCGAYLQSLQRIRIGPYHIEDSLHQKDLTSCVPLAKWVRHENIL
ncbi:MAG: tRNA pseudouridine(55) synthase TruB [Chlamydiota bacterium]